LRGRRKGFFLNPTRDLPGGISCPALYYQGLCVLRDACGLPIGQLLGEGSGNAYTFPLRLRRISFSQCLFQVGRSLEPDTSLDGTDKLCGPIKALSPSSLLILQFRLFLRTDHTQLFRASCPTRAWGLLPPNSELAVLGAGKWGWGGSGFVEQGEMLQSELLNGECCCP
jgi:hypothetical protein